MLKKYVAKIRKVKELKTKKCKI